MKQYCSPELYIGGEQIYNVSSVKFSEKGGSTINSLNVTLTDPVYDEYRWYNQKVEFFLNYGSPDTVPLFRGYVRQINPTDRNFSFTAMDPRTFLTGKESTPINLTDTNNYDGYTLTQFIYSYIDNVINTNGILIGLDMLNETDPPVLMKNRRESGDAYKFISGAIPKNTNDIKKPYNYNIKMVEGIEHSNIVINRERDIEDAPATEFSYEDGISKLSAKRRPSPNFYNIKTEDDKTITYKKGNMPTGPIGKELKGKFSDTDSAKISAIVDSIIEEDEIQEINMTVTKGHYLGTGNVVKLNVEDDELRRVHRIKSRELSWSATAGVKTTFVLNKDVPTMKSYIQ